MSEHVLAIHESVRVELTLVQRWPLVSVMALHYGIVNTLYEVQAAYATHWDPLYVHVGMCALQALALKFVVI